MRAAGAARAREAAAGEGAFERWLASVWWRPRAGAAAWALWPFSRLYGLLAGLNRRLSGSTATAPVPVIVVGNLVVGGAGKTPIVIALVQALQAAGRHPGVISRGHGRRDAAGTAVAQVVAASTAHEVGDEPLLIHRRTGVPVFVGPRRAEVANALCTAHPAVDVIVSDDGLQHHALARVAELIVFDDRGAGNGMLLPAGPLRQRLPRAMPAHARVAYTGRFVSTALPGMLVARSATRVLPLAAWSASDESAARPLASLKARRLTALAGIGAPEQFFAMLEREDLAIDRLPCRDHAEYAEVPWPEGTREVITTEKDAVKLAALPRIEATVWVLPLDCELPVALVRDLIALLPAVRAPARASGQEPHR
ncbi:MAG: tetraacyldisaccharide 4'-kinase [Rubrivivax sp.]|nr:tetraacyldisaccharide 4'-kinase [Rubrivivax sp.]